MHIHTYAHARSRTKTNILTHTHEHPHTNTHAHTHRRIYITSIKYNVLSKVWSKILYMLLPMDHFHIHGTDEIKQLPWQLSLSFTQIETKNHVDLRHISIALIKKHLHNYFLFCLSLRQPSYFQIVGKKFLRA